MIQITCINKDGGNHYNPYEGITNFGWWDPDNKNRGNSNRQQMVEWLEQGGKAFTRDAFNNVAWLVVRSPNSGNKYVQTYADGKWSDNLLALNECVI